jgi:hypothetical protein
MSSSREARRKTVGDAGDAEDIVVTIGNNPRTVAVEAE